MALSFEGFGVARGEQIEVWHLDWNAPSVGVWELRGRGAGELGLVLSRQVLPETHRYWGALTYDGADWRVRPPAVFRRYGASSPAARVEHALTRHMPARTLAATLEGGRDGTWASDLIARHGVQDLLELGARVDELSPPSQAIVSLLTAAARRPSVVVLQGDGWSASSRVWGVVERLAQDALVVCVGDTGGRADVIDLGRDGVYTDGTPRDVPPPPPSWLTWFQDERLAGMPRPGRRGELEAALDALETCGVTHVVTLEEEHHNASALRARGFIAWHTPIVDMHAPGLDEARELVARIVAAMDQGARVALHCKAGIGRTGTIAVCVMIERGYTMRDALVLLRGWNRHYVQTDAQLEFLETFESDHKERHA